MGRKRDARPVRRIGQGCDVGAGARAALSELGTAPSGLHLSLPAPNTRVHALEACGRARVSYGRTCPV